MGGKQLIFGIVAVLTIALIVVAVMLIAPHVIIRHEFGSAPSIESVPSRYQAIIRDLHPTTMQWTSASDPWLPQDRIVLTGRSSAEDFDKFVTENGFADGQVAPESFKADIDDAFGNAKISFELDGSTEVYMGNMNGWLVRRLYYNRAKGEFLIRAWTKPGSSTIAPARTAAGSVGASSSQRGQTEGKGVHSSSVWSPLRSQASSTRKRIAPDRFCLQTG
jgi:hypothetical protein